MKIIKKSISDVYAYNTNATKAKSMDEIERELKKHGAISFSTMNDEERGTRWILFKIQTKSLGLVPVRIEIPEIWVKRQNQKTRKWETVYLERESYRALVLIVKSKLVLVDYGEPPESAFLLDIASKAGLLRDVLLGPNSSIPQLLAKNGA